MLFFFVAFVPPGEGAADGSQVQKLVDMGNYNDGYKWSK
jgi:hypothetical protein